jgi:methylthioribose-1-phosphate isomerase
VDLVVVGADRIAANGDVANKIGTYGVAVLAREHGIPFYVAAPISTVDLDTPDGGHIPIEERSEKEVTHVGTSRITPGGARIRNPAFDVTPAKYVTAIVTERGIATAPYNESLARLAGSAGDRFPEDPASAARTLAVRDGRAVKARPAGRAGSA